MKFILANPPRTSNEAFEALDRVFGGDEFSIGEAEEVLKETLDMSSSEARNELSRLLRSGCIEEV